MYLALGNACNAKDKLKYAEPAVILSDKLLSHTTNEKEKKTILKQKASAFKCFIPFYGIKNDTSKILGYYRKQLSIYLEIKDTTNIVALISELASIYAIYFSNFPKALEYSQQGLSISKEMQYKKGIAQFLGQAGGMYEGQALALVS